MNGLDADKLTFIHTDNTENLHICGLLMFNSETTGVISEKLCRAFKIQSNEMERNNTVHLKKVFLKVTSPGNNT